MPVIGVILGKGMIVMKTKITLTILLQVLLCYGIYLKINAPVSTGAGTIPGGDSWAIVFILYILLSIPLILYIFFSKK